MKEIPEFIVTDEQFEGLANGQSHLYTMPLDENSFNILPPAYESADHTILVFPARECPDTFSFKTKDGRRCERKVMNIMAYKLDDGTEIIKVRLK